MRILAATHRVLLTALAQLAPLGAAAAAGLPPSGTAMKVIGRRRKQRQRQQRRRPQLWSGRTQCLSVIGRLCPVVSAGSQQAAGLAEDALVDATACLCWAQLRITPRTLRHLYNQNPCDYAFFCHRCCPLLPDAAAEIEIAKRPDGSPWELGSGGFGKASCDVLLPTGLPVVVMGGVAMWPCCADR